MPAALDAVETSKPDATLNSISRKSRRISSSESRLQNQTNLGTGLGGGHAPPRQSEQIDRIKLLRRCIQILYRTSKNHLPSDI